MIRLHGSKPITGIQYSFTERGEITVETNMKIGFDMTRPSGLVAGVLELTRKL